MMPAYDGNAYSPPAPVAEVTVCNPENGSILPGVFMLIDSGADVTILPRSAVGSLELAGASGTYEAMAFDGTVGVYEATTADLIFSQKKFTGKFLVLDQPFGILGRDILNHVSIVLDGPNLNWDVS